MELSILVGTVVNFLAPYLPYLSKAGEKAAEELGKQISTATWNKAKALWDKLWPIVEKNPLAQDAVEKVGNNPLDEAAQAALRLQLKKLLAEDADLAQTIAEMVNAGAQAGVIVIAAGERSVALGGHILGSTMTITIGDKGRDNT